MKVPNSPRLWPQRARFMSSLLKLPSNPPTGLPFFSLLQHFHPPNMQPKPSSSPKCLPSQTWPPVSIQETRSAHLPRKNSPTQPPSSKGLATFKLNLLLGQTPIDNFDALHVPLCLDSSTRRRLCPLASQLNGSVGGHVVLSSKLTQEMRPPQS